MAPRLRTLPQLRFGEPVAGPSLASDHADGFHHHEARPDRKSVSARLKRGLFAQICHNPPRGLVCRTSSPSFFLGLAVEGRVRLSPSTVCLFAASGPRVRRHSRFSPAAYGPRASHLSVQHFTLHQPKQGRRGLFFVVEGVSASRPSRHPISGMSSFARHSASSIAFYSRMGAYTGGIALCSPHNSVQLHTSVWEKSPPL